MQISLAMVEKQPCGGMRPEHIGTRNDVIQQQPHFNPFGFVVYS